MKRDMDLVRKLLLFIEEHQENDPLQSGEISIDGYGEGVIGYHLKLMVDGGLLDAEDTPTFDSVSFDFFIHNISWEGHEFLDSIRDDSVWRGVKEKLKPIGTATLPIVTALATQGIKQIVGLH